MMRKFLFLSLLSLLSAPAFGQAWSGTIDPARAVDWSSAGATITGAVVQCGSTIPAYNGSAAAINTAIAACTSGQFVSLGAGTFNLTSGIDYNNHSGVTVRGAGADQTKIVFTGNVNCFGLSTDVCFRNGNNSSAGSPQNTANWTAGYARAGTSITLSSTANLGVGNNLVLDQLNDSNTDTGQVWICEALGVCASEGPSGAERSNRAQSQIVTVTGIVGSTVSFSPGLYMPNWATGKTPGGWWANTTLKSSGIENLSMDHTASGATSGVLFFNANSCWVKGVRSIDANRNHVWIFQSARTTVRDSYFYQTQNRTSQSYGVEPYLSSDSLIENNIFDSIAAPVTVNGSASGSVVSYNYAINDLSSFSTSLSAMIWLHSAGVDNILFEGNAGPAFFGDNIHGTHNFITVFRNYFPGWATGQTSQTWPILVAPYGRYFNLLGNVLGRTGYHNTYQGSSATSIYNLGNTINGIGPDTKVGTTSYRFGAYDTVTAAVRWCGNSGNTGWSTTCSSTSEVPTGISPYPNAVPTAETFPASFYLPSQPPFWVTPYGTPPYPPIGPDVSGGTGPGAHTNSIPSQLCYSNGTFVSGVLTFNAAACYGTAPTTPVVSLSPSSLAYGNQLINTPSGSQAVTLTNTGTATLNISGITLTGADAAVFSKTTTCGATVAASASCTVTVTFTPTSTGAKTAAISFADDAAGSPQTVPLTGTGTAPGASASPSSLSFGNQAVGTSSSVQGITFTNTGTATLHIVSITFTGSDITQFSKTTTCGSTLVAGANCSVAVTFSPTGTGAKSASVTFTDDAATSPQSVTLTGTGVTPTATLIPATGAYGNQIVNVPSAAQNFTLTNTSAVVLTISSIMFTGANASMFSKTTTCGGTLAASGTCTVSVVFTPTSTGAKSATLSIADSATGSPQTVSLTGTGVPATTSTLMKGRVVCKGGVRIK